MIPIGSVLCCEVRALRFVLGMGSEQDYAIAERVNTVAERLGCKPAQVALAWVLGLPGVTAPIVGASKPHL